MSQPSNRRAYTTLLAYPNPESIPYEELAKSIKVPRVKLQGLAGALFRGAPRALLEPRGAQEEPSPQEPGAKGEPLPEPGGAQEELRRSQEEPGGAQEEPGGAQ